MSIAFSIEPFEDGGPAEAVVPVVDGVTLAERIDTFELAAGMRTTPAPTYGGLPVDCGFGPAAEHYLGRSSLFVRPERVLLLGCTCGDWGCHPLFAHVDADADAVRWSDFEQPNHRERDVFSRERRSNEVEA